MYVIRLLQKRLNWLKMWLVAQRMNGMRGILQPKLQGFNPTDMERIEKFMKEAIDLAGRNAGSVTGGPFGALIVRGEEIISAQTNSVTPDKDPTAHAEVNAIREACKKLDRSEERRVGK